MRKSISLALNKYPSVPDSLKGNLAKNTPIDQMDVDPARLFHHYYLDTRGYAPLILTRRSLNIFPYFFRALNSECAATASGQAWLFGGQPQTKSGRRFVVGFYMSISTSRILLIWTRFSTARPIQISEDTRSIARRRAMRQIIFAPEQLTLFIWRRPKGEQAPSALRVQSLKNGDDNSTA